MEFTHEFHVPDDPETTFARFVDLRELAPCVPGLELDAVDGATLRGRLALGSGPDRVTYAGVVRAADVDVDARLVHLEAAATASTEGGVTVEVVASLSPDGDGTLVAVLVDIETTGGHAPLAAEAAGGGAEAAVEAFARRLRTVLATGEVVDEVAADPVDADPVGAAPVEEAAAAEPADPVGAAPVEEAAAAETADPVGAASADEGVDLPAPVGDAPAPEPVGASVAPPEVAAAPAVTAPAAASASASAERTTTEAAETLAPEQRPTVWPAAASGPADWEGFASRGRTGPVLAVLVVLCGLVWWRRR